MSSGAGEVGPSWQSTRVDFQAGGLYGDLEPYFRGLRAAAPQDLSLGRWKSGNPGKGFGDWQKVARAAAMSFLSCDPGVLDLQADVLSTENREGYVLERVAFQTAPWSRVEGVFAKPHGPGPFPAVIALHSWGGPMILGKERIFPLGPVPSRLAEFLEGTYGGNFIGEELVHRGFAVLAIDAFHFSSRLPWGAKVLAQNPEPWLPERPDVLALDVEMFDRLDAAAKSLLDIAYRYVGWAGTTWTGINFCDDSRCVDYLLSRPDVDGTRIGCVGHSGGGYRSHFLAALDTRIRASVSSGWFTTGDWTQAYRLVGPIGPAHLVSGLWRRMDFPDIAALAAPRAKLIVCGQDDPLFAPEAMAEAAERVRSTYEWAGAPERFQFFFPAKPHCFDAECQSVAWDFFDRWLGCQAV